MLPVAGLLAYWAGGELGLTALAAALPLAMLAHGPPAGRFQVDARGREAARFPAP